MIKYNELRQQIDTGDIVEWSSDSLLGKIIKWKTKKPVNHSSLCVKLHSYNEWKEPHRFILEAVEDGINLNLLSKEISKFKGEVYYSKLKPEFNKYRMNIAAWALLQIGVKYDYKSLFANVFGPVNSDIKRYFCSEFVYYALLEVGIIDKQDKIPVPGDFEKFSIYEPKIKVIK